MEARSKLMKYRELGNTGIRVSELGFGCASIWGKPFFPENEAIELFLAAYETGINFYDTGFSYDEAEVRLGKCVERLGIENRDKIVIATKCGTRISDTGKCYHDWNPEWLKQSVEISLRRLGTSYVDMLHLHGPSISDISDSVLKLLDDMKSDGIVKAVGVNSFDTDVLEFILSQKYFDFVMLDYNILRQDREDLIARLHDSGIGVIGGAALAQSLFSGRIFNIRNRIDIWYLLRALKNWRKQIVTGGGYRFINSVSNITGTQIALRYVLDNANVSSSVFGTSSIEHLIENCKASDVIMPKEMSNKIKQQGHKNGKKRI